MGANVGIDPSLVEARSFYTWVEANLRPQRQSSHQSGEIRFTSGNFNLNLSHPFYCVNTTIKNI
jgi:hypothetical protein